MPPCITITSLRSWRNLDGFSEHRPSPWNRCHGKWVMWNSFQNWCAGSKKKEKQLVWCHSSNHAVVTTWMCVLRHSTWAWGQQKARARNESLSMDKWLNIMGCKGLWNLCWDPKYCSHLRAKLTVTMSHSTPHTPYSSEPLQKRWDTDYWKREFPNHSHHPNQI